MLSLNSRFNEIRLGSNGIFSEFRFLNNGSLAIDNAIYGDDSLYCCQATNEIGTASACVSVTLMGEYMIYESMLILNDQFMDKCLD